MLRGHSKFTISLIKNNKGYLVKKRAWQLELINRLMRQASKQKNFEKVIKNTNHISEIFEVPQVLEMKGDYFTMPFYNGKNILTLFEKGNITILDELIDNLFMFIDWELSQCKDENCSEIIIDKLNTLNRKHHLDTELIKILNKINSYLNKNPLIFPKGIAHGDFTLSNMIFSDKIILIDFLDTYLDTPIQDITKLMQEVNLKWSLLMKPRQRDLTKINISYDHIKTNLLHSIEKKYSNYSKQIEIMYLVTLLRIIPYVSNFVIYKAIFLEIKHYMEEHL
jgi:hypothetical protein